MARLIDAEEFAKRLMDLWDKAEVERRNDIVSVLANYITPCLVGTPTIDPVKHGKWIEKYGTWYCSECDKTGYKGYIPAKPSDYCPNCGARMDGEKE